MAESIVSDLASRLVESLAQCATEKIASYFGGRQKFNELQETMRLIEAQLADAERQHEEDKGKLIKEWLRALKRVLYRFEDLLEEVAYSEEKGRSPSSSKLTKLVCYLPSKLSALSMNKTIAQEVDDIMSELSRLKNDMAGLCLEVVPQPTLNLVNTRETYSFVREDTIIGRNEDKDVIVGMVLNSHHVNKGVLLVVPIVGMGGLGKTALAQLVFNDDKVKQHFQCRSRFWACISDKLSGLKELIGKVLDSMTDEKNEWHTWSLENLQSRLRDVVKEKQFLLVLDDIWDEHGDWLSQLRDLLHEAKPGSVVIVTSRSEVVASRMGTAEPYKLQGLIEDQSWELFRSLAFREGQEEACPNLATIGREIVKKCGNVPLAIRTIAGLLFSRYTEQEWINFRDREIGMIDQDQNGIMPTLALSYYHLSPQLKQCFAYCSLYPKDYEFEIQDLIWRWLAQGYINSSSDGHAYFMELLRRCFFQDVTTNVFGIMVRCKMHDLMHDLALSVGDECLIVDKPDEHINSNFRHVTVILDGDNSISPVEAPWLFASQPARSFYLPLGKISDLNAICLHFRLLRVLDLGLRSAYASLPNSIGKLKHLRYLKLNANCFPKGITRLLNLQTMNVSTYSRWGELPRGFTKLTSLRHLMITRPLYDDALDDMPPNFGQLKHLETLSFFIVGKNNGLDALSRMNIIGDLKIFFKANRQNIISEAMAANLKAKMLTHITLSWLSLEEQSNTQADELLRCLSLPPTLKALKVKGFKMVRFNWEIVEFPNIVNIDISDCTELRYLPFFGGLPHLKKLRLWALRSLEYVEATSLSSTTIYFPSLEELELGDMDNLQEWWEKCQQLQQFFPRLASLKTYQCERLKSLPWSMFAAQDFWMPLILESLIIIGCEELDLWVQNSDGSHCNNFSTWQRLSNLRSLILWRNSKLQALPSGIGHLTQLQSIQLLEMDNLQTLTQDIGHLTKLRELIIRGCPKLEGLPKSFRNLTALQRLLIWGSPHLARRCKEGGGEDWPLIQHISDKDIR